MNEIRITIENRRGSFCSPSVLYIRVDEHPELPGNRCSSDPEGASINNEPKKFDQKFKKFFKVS